MLNILALVGALAVLAAEGLYVAVVRHRVTVCAAHIIEVERDGPNTYFRYCSDL